MSILIKKELWYGQLIDKIDKKEQVSSFFIIEQTLLFREEIILNTYDMIT